MAHQCAAKGRHRSTWKFFRSLNRMAASMYTKSIHRETVGRQTPLSEKDRGPDKLRQHHHATNGGENLDPLSSCTLNSDTFSPTAGEAASAINTPVASYGCECHGKKRQRAQNTASKHLSLPQLALGLQSDTWSLVLMGGMPLNQSDIRPTWRSSLTYAMSNSKKLVIGKCAWARLYF